MQTDRGPSAAKAGILLDTERSFTEKIFAIHENGKRNNLEFFAKLIIGSAKQFGRREFRSAIVLLGITAATIPVLFPHLLTGIVGVGDGPVLVLMGQNLVVRIETERGRLRFMVMGAAGKPAYGEQVQADDKGDKNFPGHEHGRNLKKTNPTPEYPLYRINRGVAREKTQVGRGFRIAPGNRDSIQPFHSLESPVQCGILRLSLDCRGFSNELPLGHNNPLPMDADHERNS